MLARLTLKDDGYQLTYTHPVMGVTYKVSPIDWHQDSWGHIEVYDATTDKTLIEYDSAADNEKEFALDMAQAFIRRGCR